MVTHLTKKSNKTRKSAPRNNHTKTRTRAAVMAYRSNHLGQMEQITYPDGEAVHYGYDYGGNVTSITGRNRGEQFPYVRQIGYDEWGQRIYLQLGNGVETSLEI